MQLTTSDQERFWAKVQKGDGPDACWLWTAAVNTGGAGIVFLHGKSRIAWKVAVVVTEGAEYPRRWNRNTCGNKRCVNPKHWRSPEDWVPRFWSKVQKAGAHECWEWRGARTQGYGLFRMGRSDLRSHRVMYELVHGPLSPGQVVRHRCDNPPCVNPAHLEAGSPADNSRDMVEPHQGDYRALGKPLVDGVEVGGALEVHIPAILTSVFRNTRIIA